jgi:hypothetical protein
MPIIRVTKKQIEEANKAREAGLQTDANFQRHKQRQRFEEAAVQQAAAQVGTTLVSCLKATFTLTPLSPTYQNVSLGIYAELWCDGADFWPWSPSNLSSLYASNQFYFYRDWAADATLDYAQSKNRYKAQLLSCGINLQSYAGANKQLALIFGFDVEESFPHVDARVLVYSDAGLLQDQTLMYYDNQFLLEIESLDLPLGLYFIHAGGSWFFNGLSGYVV